MAKGSTRDDLVEVLARVAQDEAPERLLAEAFAQLEKLKNDQDHKSEISLAKLQEALIEVITSQRPEFSPHKKFDSPYQSLFEYASDAIMVLNEQGEIVDVNPALCTLLGYSRAELLQMNRSQIFSPEAYRASVALSSRLRIGETQVESCELLARSGVLIPVEATATCLPDGRVFARIHDVSSLRDKERKMLAQSSMLQALRRINHRINRSSEPKVLIEEFCAALVEERHWPGAWILLTDVAGRAQIWTERGLGPSVQSTIALYQQDGPLPCMIRVVADSKVQHFTRSDCTFCPVAKAHPELSSIVAEIVHNGRSYGFLCAAPSSDFEIDTEELKLLGEMAEDLGFALRAAEIADERRQAIERLRDEMSKAQQYLALAPVVLLALDLKGQIILVNRAGTEIFARQEYALLGHELAEFVDASQQDLLLKYLEQLKPLQEGEVQEFELTLTLLHSELRQVSWKISPRRDELGELTGSFWAGLDVTDTRHAEQQLAQSDRLATIGQLAAGVAHEINNPLTYVLYNLEEVANRLPELISTVEYYAVQDQPDLLTSDENRPAMLSMDELKDLNECVRDARSGTERVRDIVRDLKVFSREDKIETAPVDLAQAIETAMSLALNEIKYRAKLNKDLGPTPMVQANEGRISQVVLNLLINASQAIHEGQVHDNVIEVKTWAEKDLACFSVRDSGTGIPASQLAKIFEPFYTTKPKGIGTGLGLSICRSIVESYDGHIEAKSEVGRGTVFEVKFPRMRITLDDVEDDDDETSEPRQVGARILVIDDDSLLRALVVRTLAKQHQVVSVGSGAEALDLIADDKAFDLILCDIMMPEVTGIDLYYHLQESVPELTERILFMTGGVFTASAKEFLLECPYGFLEKPFEIKTLRKFIDNFLRREISN